MMKLMKYEFRKTMAMKLIALGAAALAEIVFLIGLWGDRERVLGTGIGLLVMLAFGSVIVIGLASVVILHRDLNTKQSYMLFMTPNSCYKILGAKMLENGLSVLLTGAAFFALGVLDITLLFAHQSTLADLWDMVKNVLAHINQEIVFDLPTMLTLTANMLGSWISTISAMYLGVVISTALLNGKRFNGLLSFVLILALLWFVGWVQLKSIESIHSVQTAFLVETCVALVSAVIMYFFTAQIMERKLSV